MTRTYRPGKYFTELHRPLTVCALPECKMLLVNLRGPGRPARFCCRDHQLRALRRRRS